ncbi:hypothetical protein HH212_13220 [Massilia forsythiae]|uniref:Porin n=1 Tax=Massilia forsythiae TaxID=2728020 RepID=A0A7Z2ZT46_9BURK|nr:hypothetical protein [Massilia forsythiae]QJE00865.1 hypothetical protein HH212_13220 [Massilia forsythiae]
MTLRPWIGALLLGCAGAAWAQTTARQPADDQTATLAQDDHGAYLSIGFGDGRMHGQNDTGTRWMQHRTFEVRAGRREPELLGGGRIDFIHYNEGHPDNNHRDGFAVQWLAVRPLGRNVSGEFGAGPYLSMNTTIADGRQQDDSHLGLLLSATLRFPLDSGWANLPDGTHLRVGVNQVMMHDAHNSTAVLVGIGRQFGETRAEPDTEPATGPWWVGGSIGRSITNLSNTDSANAGVLEARKYLDERMDHWAVSGKAIYEGNDGTRVDRRGLAGQLWYVQQVTPRLSMSAGLGPYVAWNKYDADRTRANVLISFQAERALSRRTRAFVNFNRVKTFRQTNDRDLFQLGILKRF